MMLLIRNIVLSPKKKYALIRRMLKGLLYLLFILWSEKIAKKKEEEKLNPEIKGTKKWKLTIRKPKNERKNDR